MSTMTNKSDFSGVSWICMAEYVMALISVPAVCFVRLNMSPNLSREVGRYRLEGACVKM